MKIVVLAGGYSPERDVSLSSGSLIANALIENGHSVALVDLYMGLSPDMELDEQFFDAGGGKKFSFQIPSTEPDLDALRRESGNGGSLIGSRVIDICKAAELVFFALHGSIGENGQLQAALDCFGIAYTGTGYLGSAIAMDKDIAKKLMSAAGVPTPRWEVVDIEKKQPGELIEAAKRFGLPCAVKPLGSGSSIGVSLVKAEPELKAALASVKKHERMAMFEELVEGREFSIGILDGAALPVIEIIPNEGFYDYANKYQPGFTKEICPADLSPNIAEEMQAAALKAHRALRLGLYSRVDFMLDAKNHFYCLEANALPGMTPTSLLPQEAAAAGVSYNELCERIALDAIKRGANLG